MLGQTGHTGQQKTSAQNPPWIFGAICPARPRLSCRSAIPAGCRGTSKKYRHSRLLSSSLTRRAGTPPANWISRTISPCCRHAARPPMSGNICDKTGCQTASFRTRSFPSVVTQPHRKTMENQVHWIQKMGTWVLTFRKWYDPGQTSKTVSFIESQNLLMCQAQRVFILCSWY